MSPTRLLSVALAGALLATACSSASTESDAGTTATTEDLDSPRTTEQANASSSSASPTTSDRPSDTLSLDQANEAFVFNIDSLVHDGERFVVPLGPSFAGPSKFASFSSVDGTEWDMTPAADPEFSPQEINSSVDRVAEWNVFVPFAPFELVDEPMAYISNDTTNWEALPFTPPAEPIDETLMWLNFALIWPDVDAFMLGLRPVVNPETIDFQGVGIRCVAPCRDRYVSLEDDREIVFTTDLDSSFERFFFAGDGGFTEVLGPALTTRYLLGTSTGPLAIERLILGEHRAARLTDGRWEPADFTPPPGNLFMIRSHRGRFYAFTLQLGGIFELFVSDDEAATWQSIAMFDEDDIGSFGPTLDLVGGADQQVAIALGGNPSQIIYAEDGINFETVVEHPWPDEPIGVHDLALSDDQLGYLFGSPSQAAFLDLP